MTTRRALDREGRRPYQHPTMRALLVVLVSLIAGSIGLVAVELLARLGEGFGCQNETASVATRNRFYGWGHIPGSSGWSQRCLQGKPEFRTFVRINGLGLHDREIPYARSAARRILVLGDSFTEAFQVELDEGFSKRLKASLNAPDPPGARVEIVNAGVSGWGTDNALLFFQTEGWRYRPDVVMLVFNTGNDVFETIAPSSRSAASIRTSPTSGSSTDGSCARTTRSPSTPP